MLVVMANWQNRCFRLRWVFALLWVMLLLIAGIIAITFSPYFEYVESWARLLDEALKLVFGDSAPPLGWIGLMGLFLLYPGYSRFAYMDPSLIPGLILGLLLAVTIWTYLQPTRRHMRSLPALRPPTLRSRVTYALMLSLLITGLLWLVLDLTVGVPEALVATVGRPVNVSPMFEDKVFHTVLVRGQADERAIQYVPGWAGAAFAGLGLVVLVPGLLLAQHLRHSNTCQRYWLFERQTRRLIIGGMALVAVSMVTGLVVDAKLAPTWLGYFETWPPGVYTALLLGLYVALWAYGCRVMLLFMLARYEKAARDRDGTDCFACGYDLRGSVGHAKTCPECGHAIPQAMRAPAAAAPADQL